MERYDKAVDALNSTEGAKKHGIVPGGGISYLRAS
jgi:chaperonin GroEL (HSP60 family)